MLLRSLYRLLSRPGVLQSHDQVLSLSAREGAAMSTKSDLPSSSSDGGNDAIEVRNSGELKSILVDTLNLERLDNNLYRADHLIPGGKNYPAVFGGQVISQALVAAAKTITSDYNVHSLHSYFLKAGSVKKPILYNIDRARDGRSFCTRWIRASQDGEEIYTAEISFHKEEPNSIEHQSPMPKVRQPGDLRDGRTVIRDCLNDPKIKLEKLHRAFLERRLGDLPTTFDVKPVCPDSYSLLKKSEPRFFTWLKVIGHIDSDDRLHQCVAAYISDSTLLGTALFPHVSRGFTPSMLFSLDHTIWFHNAKFRIDDWLLYETESPVARGGRTVIHGRLWSRDGILILSATQEALVRGKV